MIGVVSGDRLVPSRYVVSSVHGRGLAPLVYGTTTTGEAIMGDMHPLGALITRRMRVEDWSLDEVVARAESCGEVLGRSNLNRLRREPVISISKSVINGIAAGIGVSPALVAAEAVRSMGIEPPVVETDCLAAIDADPTLSDANRRQLLLLVEQMRRDTADRRRPLGWAADTNRPPMDVVLDHPEGSGGLGWPAADRRQQPGERRAKRPH